MVLSVLERKKKHVENAIRWNKNNPERYAEIKKAYRLRNLEKIRKTNREWAKRNRKWRREYERKYRSRPEIKKHYREYMLRWHLFRREKIVGLPKPQKCPVCKRKPLGGKRGKGRMVVDHDHKTGRVRGWLCDDCNVALGRVNDSVLILKGLIKYLKSKKR